MRIVVLNGVNLDVLGLRALMPPVGFRTRATALQGP